MYVPPPEEIYQGFSRTAAQEIRSDKQISVFTSGSGNTFTKKFISENTNINGDQEIQLKRLKQEKK